MRFSFKLQLIILPFIVLPAALVALIFVLNTSNAIGVLNGILMTAELKQFVRTTGEEYEVLSRLGVEDSQFYERSARDKVLAYAGERDVLGGFLFVLRSDGTVVLLPGSEPGSILDTEHPFHETVLLRSGSVHTGTGPGRLKLRGYDLEFDYFPQWDWILGVAVSEEEAFHAIGRSFSASLLLVTISVAIAMGVLSLVAHGVAKPIERLEECAERMGRGDLAVRATVASKDEIGSLSSAFNRMAERLLELNTGLEHEVQERTRELKETIEVLHETRARLVEQEKLAALGGLVAGVAHEINTPIGVGVTAASFMKTKSEEMQRLLAEGEVSGEQLTAYLAAASESSDIVLRNLERAHRLIGSFKQLATDQTGENRRSFDVNSYLEDIIVSLQPRIRETDVTVRIECPEDLSIDGYPGLISQIITNLVMNSLVHGFEIAQTGEIRIVVVDRGESVELRYSDNGRGMEEEVRRRIFEPFFTTRRGKGGTGLGMNIVYNIVTGNMGGTIDVHSAPNEGVRVEIAIPK
jgi:signal transduction histidine kinase